MYVAIFRQSASVIIVSHIVLAQHCAVRMVNLNWEVQVYVNATLQLNNHQTTLINWATIYRSHLKAVSLSLRYAE